MSKVVKKFGIDFHSVGGALTLEPSCIGKNKSGWTIEGHIVTDYKSWVNNFVATHQKYGVVSGNFEKEVVAESEKAFQHFYKNHSPKSWDYRDL